MCLRAVMSVDLWVAPASTVDTSNRSSHHTRIRYTVSTVAALPIRRIASPCSRPACPAPSPSKLGKAQAYHKNSSTKAKIQNDGNRNVDRAVFGGGRDYTGGIKCYSLHRALTVGCKSPLLRKLSTTEPPCRRGERLGMYHIDTNWPMMFRIASACQFPASRPAPSVQARKNFYQYKTINHRRLL